MVIKTDKHEHIEHHVDLCIVGGGLSGMFAAISAARNGTKVLLMQDRPMLGGNCSSEIRMWIRGAIGSKDQQIRMENRETGLISELEEENIYTNPNLTYSIWDGVMWNMVKKEKNITLLLNCSCVDADMDGKRIVCVRGWQLTTYTWHTVYATYFADCSGDSVLAPLTGARFRVGREGNDEYGETIGPKTADRKTMGMSCLLQARETDHPVVFKAPEWANIYESDEDFAVIKQSADTGFEHCSAEAKAKANVIKRSHKLATSGTNFWWIELGGDGDTIHDTESLRDELLAIAYGIWDHIKNRGDHGAENWELEWVGFLPGKRESRRYIGKYIMTQHDIESGGHFDDIVAYGGWPMDDHNPAGFRATLSEPPSLLHPTPPVYGIPLRAMYTPDVDNLFFAGRNISATHAAMSSSRVMATCAVIGQGMGRAAAMCIEKSITPDELCEKHIRELQRRLRDDGCFIPYSVREIPALSLGATLNISDADRALLFNGIERPDENWTVNYITLPIGGELKFDFGRPEDVGVLRIRFDQDYKHDSVSVNKKMRVFTQRCCTGLDFKPVTVAKTLVKAFTVYADGREVYSTSDWHLNLFRLDLGVRAREITVKFNETWGEESVHIFSCDVDRA